MALSFLPMLLLSPVGGIVADRVNKRNVMVCLDFFTAALMLFYTLSFETLPLVPLLIAVLMLLYGIQGAYQPTVQSSLPVLVPPDKLLAGNAVINMVNSLSGMVGPILGGLIFGFYGIKPILYLSIICFFSLPSWKFSFTFLLKSVILRVACSPGYFGPAGKLAVYPARAPGD